MLVDPLFKSRYCSRNICGIIGKSNIDRVSGDSMPRLSKKLLESIEEIVELEKTRAAELLGKVETSNLIRDFREHFIVRGFLMPLYSLGSSSFETRIGSFGKYILPENKYGQQLSQRDRSWIRNEDTAFWWYVIAGQEMFGVEEDLEAFMKIEGQPAVSIWRAISGITGELNLSGETGGGVLFNSDELDTEKMINIVGNINRQEDDEGWLEDYPIPGTPKWVSLFWKYQRSPLKNNLEIRPAWFHILNYAFYDIPIERIPVFFVLYTPKGKIERIHFLDERLSHQARSTVSDALNKATLNFQEQIGGESVKKSRSDMVFWLWFNVGHPDIKKPLSYGQIAERENKTRQTIQSNVRRIDNMLKKLDYRIIWELMGVGEEIGLGSNMVYQVLVQKGVAPEGGIDDFSRAEEIRQALAVFNPKFK